MDELKERDRCSITGNPCGTDTWPHPAQGYQDCPCGRMYHSGYQEGLGLRAEPLIVLGDGSKRVSVLVGDGVAGIAISETDGSAVEPGTIMPKPDAEAETLTRLVTIVTEVPIGLDVIIRACERAREHFGKSHSDAEDQENG